jgi:hypothetical protein
MINKEIIVFSATRTGSTLIWQCLNEIFEKVHKVHPSAEADFEFLSKLLRKELPCVIIERDPVESFLSKLRVDISLNGDTVKKFLLCIKEEMDNYVGTTEGLKKFCPYINSYLMELTNVQHIKDNYKGEMLVLDYNKFFNNHDFIFEEFENFFEIQIPTEVKDRIVEKTNLSANEKIQGQFKDFNSYCEKSHIHGEHILSGEPDFYKSIVGAINYSKLRSVLSCDKNERDEFFKTLGLTSVGEDVLIEL